MGALTKKKFERQKDFAVMLADWEFYERTYDGGDEYVSKYLIMHERENADAYNRRLKESCAVNLCAPVIDLYNFYLYRTEPVRDYAFLGENKLFKAFLNDADFGSNRYQDVIKAISERGSIYGVFGIIVDKPSMEAASMAGEIENNIHPYICTYKPENIFSIEYDRMYGGKPRLVRVVLEEDGGVFREWTPTDVNVWAKESKHAEYKVVQTTKNNLGYIPFILHTNRMSLSPLSSASDIADLAGIQRSIFNNDSKMLEAMGRSAFPMLEIPDASLPLPSSPGSQADGGVQMQEIIVGAGNALIRNTGDSVGHKYVEPTMTGTDKYLSIRNSLLNDFNSISRTSHASATSTNTQSGVALEIEFQQLNALLSMKASCMERTETRILSMVADWIGSEFAGSVKYDDSFSIRDLSRDLDSAIKSLSLIESKTYKSEIAKQISRRLLSANTDESIIVTIESELDKAAVELPQPPIVENKPNGLVGDLMGNPETNNAEG